MVVSRIIVHLAVPAEKRSLASTMDNLSGDPSEFSIAAAAVGGDAAAWSAIKGYGGSYYLASQVLSRGVVQGMMADGYAKDTEVFYAAFDEASGQPVQGGKNLTEWPANSTFEAFVAGGGWELTQTGGVAPGV